MSASCDIRGDVVLDPHALPLGERPEHGPDVRLQVEGLQHPQQLALLVAEVRLCDGVDPVEVPQHLRRVGAVVERRLQAAQQVLFSLPFAVSDVNFVQDGGQWVLQVGKFKSLEPAKALMKKLQPASCLASIRRCSSDRPVCRSVIITAPRASSGRRSPRSRWASRSVVRTRLSFDDAPTNTPSCRRGSTSSSHVPSCSGAYLPTER